MEILIHHAIFKKNTKAACFETLRYKHLTWKFNVADFSLFTHMIIVTIMTAVITRMITTEIVTTVLLMLLVELVVVVVVVVEVMVVMHGSGGGGSVGDDGVT